jgi:DNA-binding GntR family transcriptional regulator
VHIPSPADVEGHYVVREALEMQAARLFAARATTQERYELVQLGARLDGLSPRPEADCNAQWSLHETFHRRIAECAACPTLNDAIEKTCALSSAWLWAGSVFLGKRPMNHHQGLAEVLSQRDPEAAAQATREHLHASKQWALVGLAPYFELAEKQTQTYSRTVTLVLHAPPVLSDAPTS